jgi:hypothetical protein
MSAAAHLATSLISLFSLKPEHLSSRPQQKYPPPQTSVKIVKNFVL